LAGFSKYPSQIDSSLELPVTTDNVTPVKAEVVNRLRDAILAIESELGIDPSREFGTVRDRLDSLSNGGSGGGGSIEILQEGSIVLPSAIGLDFVGNVSITVPQPLRARIQIIGGQATQVQETLIVSFDSQSDFTLSQTPVQPDAVIMFVDGIKQEYSTDYSVLGSAVTYAGSTSLLTTDVVEFWYLVDIGGVSGSGGGGSSADAKMRVYISSNYAGHSVGINQVVSWDAVSDLVATNNVSIGSYIFIPPNSSLSPTVAGHFLCHGQLTIQPTVDAVSGVVIEILVNSIAVHTITDNGATWGVGIPRSFSFSFPVDLEAGSHVTVRWLHNGSGPSTTTMLAGDNLSWFGLSELQ
jgi:hypothetical protein